MRASPISTALIGYGYAGKNIHARLVAACPGLKLQTICSSQGDAVCADWPGIAVVSSFEAVLKDKSIQLVILATPNATHASLARQALLAGKHVVVDKPFTVTAAEGTMLIELAHQQNRVLSVFHNRRYDADFLTVRALLAEGTLGEVKYFEAHFDRYRPQVRDRWREGVAPGSGLWYDLGSHLVDQALQLFGFPECIHADFAKQREGAQGVDYFHVLLNYPKMRVILHGSCLVGGGSPRFILHGTQGSYVKHGLDTQESMLLKGEGPSHSDWGLDPIPGTLYLPADAGVREVLYPNLHGHYEYYYYMLALALQGKGPVPIPAEEALQVVRLLEAASLQGETAV